MANKLSVDPALIRQLAELLNETGLGEIEYAEGERRIRVARPGTIAPAAPAAPAVMAAGTVAVAPTAGGAPAGAVIAPMVGTAYLAPEPGAAHFVKVGDKVNQGQTVVIIEAMKVMNAIKAPKGGTVTQIMVANGTPVEYGEPLLVIE